MNTKPIGEGGAHQMRKAIEIKSQVVAEIVEKLEKAHLL